MNNIIGQSIRAKATGVKGIITDISKKEINVSFLSGGSIRIPVASYQNVLEMEEDLQNRIEEYLQQFKIRRRKTTPSEI